MTWNTFEIGLFSVLVFCFIAQMIFYWVVLAKPYYYMQYIAPEKLQNLMEQPPVSIILYINNSYYDLLKFLSGILEQDYPCFEIIVITDGISDKDEEILERLKGQYNNLYSTHVPEDTKNVSRKKLALTLGVKATKYNLFLFTEPDCYIRSNDWISSMTRHFSDKKSIVLGFSALDNAKNLSFKYMEYDYFISNLQMISCALLDHPYSGSGRNMAYSKEHFIEQKGFVKFRILQQGEDDLFINEIATGENTAVELSAQSVIISKIDDLRHWERQKIDRMATLGFYKRGPVALWRLEASTRVVFIITAITCLACGLPYTRVPDLLLPGIVISLFLVRFFSQLFVINKTIEQLQLNKFYGTIILFDLCQPFINIYFYIYRIFRRKENYTYLL